MSLLPKRKIKFGLFLGVAVAIAIHAGAVLYGGKLMPGHGADSGTLAKVELFSEKDAVKEEKEQQPPEKTEQLETETEKVPDSAEIIRNMELAEPATPKLDAASLGSIEAALSGAGGSGDFSQGMDFSSGGRIGGTGKAGAMDKTLEDAFSLAEIDQKPRAVFQASPIYPSSMRTTEGLVTILCIVDSSGKVTTPRIEKASHPDFEKPAIDAVKQWKFEPAVKGGKRVACKIRIPIRFKPRQKA
jgi:protein TonB